MNVKDLRHQQKKRKFGYYSKIKIWMIGSQQTCMLFAKVIKINLQKPPEAQLRNRPCPKL